MQTKSMNEGYAEGLARCRETIDRIDDEILTLLNRRTEAVAEVGRLKQAHEPDVKRSFYRPDRENLILRRLTDHNPGPMKPEAVTAIFREIISQSLSFEQRQSIAYLGPEGTFSEVAAMKHFGTAPRYIPCAVFDDVLGTVERGSANMCVVPIENSTEGAVGRVLDLLVDSPLKICAEIQLPVHQNLLCLQGLEDVKAVYSHQQSLSQCHRWLNDHLPNVERVAVSSNAEAARLASIDPSACAIAGCNAQKYYPMLNVIYPCIEDDPNNTTRFIVLGQTDSQLPTGRDKTSIILAIEDRAGALSDLIQPLKELGVSMTRFESRPAKLGSNRQLWKYVFFADLAGHRRDPSVARALELLAQRAGFIKILGSYPGAID